MIAINPNILVRMVRSKIFPKYYASLDFLIFLALVFRNLIMKHDPEHAVILSQDPEFKPSLDKKYRLRLDASEFPRYAC